MKNSLCFPLVTTGAGYYKEETSQKLELEPKLKAGKDKEYKVKVIKNSAVYINEAARS